MPARNAAVRDRLSRYREIKITVTGRKSGLAISIPVWFVLENDMLYLLPVEGSDTQCYKNVLKNPLIRIDARGTDANFRPFRSLIPHGSCLWSRNSATNTVPKTLRSTIRTDDAVVALIP
jgi:hypothetical protein